jgi:hypothetical protein
MTQKPEELSAETFEVHVLKTHPEPFAAVRARKKWLEIRRHDRDFKEGDTLWLEEYDPAADHKSGEVEVRLVTHVLPGGQYGIEPGFCAISMADIPGLAASPSPEGTRERGELVEQMREALKFYRDNWDWYPGDGEQPNAVDVGAPPTFYEAEPNAALKADEGKIAAAALTLPPVPGVDREVVERLAAWESFGRKMLSADREALANHRPKWGVADCVDNDGVPYQSQWFGDALAEARALLALVSTGEGR